MLLRIIVLAVIVFVLLKIISLPIRLLWKLLINTGCGFVCLIVLNLLAPVTGILFDLNLVTAAVVGFLGLPGIILLYILHFVLQW